MTRAIDRINQLDRMIRKGHTDAEITEALDVPAGAVEQRRAELDQSNG